MRVNNGLQRKASKPTSAELARYDTNTSCTVIAQRLGMTQAAVSRAVQCGEGLAERDNFEFIQDQERIL